MQAVRNKKIQLDFSNHRREEGVVDTQKCEIINLPNVYINPLKPYTWAPYLKTYMHE